MEGWLQIGLVLLIGFLLSIPVGRYLAGIVMDRKTVVDRVFDPIDNVLYFLIGRESGEPADGLEGLHGPHAGRPIS